MKFEPGTICDTRFRIVRPIRSGGMGSVFLAEQLDLQRNVALKFLHPDADIDKGFKRFRREAKLLSMLRHPNIVMIHCFGRWNDLFYISMEYIEARSLEDLVFSAGRLPVDTITKLTLQICAALRHAHSQSVVHRDIKPSNILVTADGDVKLIDFGLSKSQQSRSQDVTEAGSTVGTVSYMSPEQCTAGEIDLRSDIYSLGCLLYYMAVGRAPFTGFDPVTVMNHHVNDELPRLPADIEEREKLHIVIDRATAKDPEKRYQSVDELLSDLCGTPVAPAVSVRTPKVQLKALTPFLAALATLPVLLTILAFHYDQPQEPVPKTVPAMEMPLAKLQDMADSQIKSGDMDGAIRSYKLALTKPQSPTDLGGTYAALLKLYYSLGRFDEAVEVGKQWVAQAKPPQSFPAMTWLAESYRADGQLEKSLAVWEQCRLQHAFRDADAYCFYARALRDDKKYKEALAAAKNGLSGNYEDAPPERTSFGKYLSEDTTAGKEEALARLRAEITLDQKALAEQQGK